jgi:tRNA nucleotidyltransferase/poly(A) polymerase
MIMAGILREAVEVDFEIKVPNEIELIKNAFKKSGYDLYLVGGAVRDSFLKKIPKDFDLATNAVPEKVKEILDNFKIYNFPKGEQFGVISAVINGEEFEIATFRQEKYDDGAGRRPTSVEYSGIDEDALRRDLTINALYYDLDKKKVIDLVGGIEDLKNGIIRTVGNPDDRIYDDRLRAMRAIRFKNVIGGDLDEKTKSAILKYKDMPGVSNERIRDEFYSGIIKSKRTSVFLNDLLSFGIFERMFPKMKINNSFYDDIKNPILVIAFLLKDNKVEDVYRMMTEMKYTNPEKKSIELLLGFNNFFNNFDSSLKTIEDSKIFDKLLNNRITGINKDLSEEDFVKWAKMNKIDENISKNFLIFQPKTSKELPELQEKGFSGKELGDEIKKINLELFLRSI